MVSSRTDVLVSLPRPLTTLLGREHELNHLYELLKSDVALVSITGFGGIGKTRLALQAAMELEPVFDAGALFASLASITQGANIPRAIALAAGLDETIDSVPALAAALGSSSRLLVLDNLEQIPDAAHVVVDLLQAMPSATILATSRNRLEINGEYVLPLEPLDTKSENPQTLPAVQLFIERAKAANPSVSTSNESIAIIAEICQKLDGIPLALELAAARLVIFSLADLRDQLQHTLPVLASKRADMPDRQRTMRNAIGWTYELLEEPEQRLFNWLSVYEPDFSLESLRHVAKQLELTDDPLDIVQFLVTRSLIRPARRESDAPRYEMLQMLREFGHEQLLQSSEDHLARRSHAMDMLALADRAEIQIQTPQMMEWFHLLQNEVPNIRRAVTWALSNNHAKIVVQIIARLRIFLNSQGYTGEFLTYVPSLNQLDLSPEELAKAHIGVGFLREFTGESSPAVDHYTQALKLAEQLNNESLLIDIHFGLGQSIMQRDGQAAIDHYRKAIEIATTIGDSARQLKGIASMGAVHVIIEETAKAIPILKTSIELADELGNPLTYAQSTGNLGVALQYEGRLDESDTYFWKGLEHAESLGDIHTVARIWTNLATNRFLLADYDGAREYADRGIALAKETRMADIDVNGTFTLIAVDVQEKSWGAAALKLISTHRLLGDNQVDRQHLLNASTVGEILMNIRSYGDAAEIMGAVWAHREASEITPTIWREAAENRMRRQLQALKDPSIAARQSMGATLSMDDLMRRYRELAEGILAKYPTDAPQPEEEVEQKPNILLTPREIEVIQAVAKGLTNAEIAEEMFVSKRTITSHLSNIFNKLEVKNRWSAIATATEAGLV